jgi:hypothetical protein
MTAVRSRSARISPAGPEPVDLDGKKRSDMVLYYPQTKGHRGEIVVLVNQGPW